MNASTANLTSEINAEFARLDCLASLDNEGGIEVRHETDLPLGWVCVADGVVTYYGPADTILAAIKSSDCEHPSERDAADDHAGFTAAHAALTAAEGVTEDRPKDSRSWPADLIEFEPLEAGTANDNPLTLATVQTNGGVRYAAGPHGANNCALGDWIRWIGPLAKDREAAISDRTGM